MIWTPPVLDDMLAQNYINPLLPYAMTIVDQRVSARLEF